MSFPVRFFSGHVATGDFDSDVAGTTNGGTSIRTNNILPGTLSCVFLVDAETDTITITGKWQVSDDNVTFVDMPTQNNAANVVLATGTAGADAAVTLAIPAPLAISGRKWVRAAVINGVATGNTVDTFSMTLNYRKVTGF